ncbi:hypothetical protein [Desertimonas flava]|nr:hypothetical protein [Desertimonas flava]
MSFTNHERGDDWELGDAISIPVDLDGDPDLVLDEDSTDDDADEADGA